MVGAMSNMNISTISPAWSNPSTGSTAQTQFDSILSGIMGKKGHPHHHGDVAMDGMTGASTLKKVNAYIDAISSATGSRKSGNVSDLA